MGYTISKGREACQCTHHGTSGERIMSKEVRYPLLDLRQSARICLSLTIAFVPLAAQDAATPDTAPPERWNLYYQATSIGQYHGTFDSPYEGPLSLRDYQERDVSLTTTLFFGLRLEDNTQLYFDPEIAGGRGFSGVDGLANPSNGELPRVASATPKPYLARLYIAHDFGFGSEKEIVESDENQLGGARPMTRYSIYAGRFSVTDFFDNNNYSHDPRTQFMAWGVMYNGAWDYPADTRGYTWGIVHEFHTRNWAFRYGIAAEPKVANGSQLDRRLFRDHGQTAEVERRYTIGQHPGAIRVLGYGNRADAGNYAEALRIARETGTTPSVVATRKVGTLKYGTGINFRTGDRARYWRFFAARMERWENREFCLYGHRPARDGRRIDKGNAMETEGRCARELVYRKRNFGRSRGVSRGGRPRLFDRRREIELLPGVRLGKLLQRARFSGILRQLGCAARYEPGVQSRSRAGVDLQSTSAFRVGAQALACQVMTIPKNPRHPPHALRVCGKKSGYCPSVTVGVPQRCPGFSRSYGTAHVTRAVP